MKPDDEKPAPLWQQIICGILLWSMIIGGLGYALYYKWNHPDRWADIEHR